MAASDLVTVQHISALLDRLVTASHLSSVEKQRKGCQSTFLLFFDRFTNDEKMPLELKDWDTFSLECLFRLLCPCRDTSRKYSIKELTFGQYIIQAFPVLSQKSAQILKYWNDPDKLSDLILPKETARKLSGNFAACVEFVFEDSASSRQNIIPHSIKSVIQLLDELASLSNYTTEKIVQSRRSRVEILKDLFSFQTPLDCKWISKIILKNMLPIQFNWDQILNALHPCLVPIYSMNACLKTTADSLNLIFQNEAFHPKNMFTSSGELVTRMYKRALSTFCKPKIGIRISSMESIQSKSIAHAYDYLFNSFLDVSFFAEIKYDGERMQIHVDFSNINEPIKIFSKSGRDSTKDRIDSHPIIIESLCKSVRNCILEAELVTIDRSSGKIQRFGGVSSFTRTKVKETSDSNRIGLYLIFFDLLYLNDLNLIHDSLESRRKQLESIIIPVSAKSQLSESTLYEIPPQPWSMDTFSQLRSQFQKIKSEGKEGLMIKGLQCSYLAGKRANWIKMKPDFMAGLADEGEYVLLGAGWNSDPYLSSVTSDDCFGMNLFFVGVLLNDFEVNLCGFKPLFGIIFTVENGFTARELMDFSEMMKEERLEVPYRSMKTKVETENYSFIFMNNSSGMKYYFKNPICVTLKGSSYEDCIRSNRIREDKDRRTFWILRHPRIERIWKEVDRDWRAALTFKQLQERGEESEEPIADSLKMLEKVLCYLDAFYIHYGKLYIPPRTKTLHETCSKSLYNIFEDENLKHMVDNSQMRKWRDSSNLRNFVDEYTQSQNDADSVQIEDFQNACLVNPPVLFRNQSFRYITPSAVFKAAGWHCSDTFQHSHYSVFIFIDNCLRDATLKALEGQCKIGNCHNMKAIIVVDFASLLILAKYDSVY